MSIKITSLVWTHYAAGGGELLTALAYADHAHDDGAGIRPSVAYIARKTRQSERTVQRYLKIMRASNWLQPIRYANGGRGRATEYRINPNWISSYDKPSPFPSHSKKRETLPVENSDIKSGKRVSMATPQPSLIIKEPGPSKEEGHSKGCQYENSPHSHKAPPPSNTLRKSEINMQGGSTEQPSQSSPAPRAVAQHHLRNIRAQLRMGTD